MKPGGGRQKQLQVIPDNQHSSTDETMKGPTEQDDNDYKPSDDSEGDEKEAIKWVMTCCATN
jgi:hypothetical protein